MPRHRFSLHFEDEKAAADRPQWQEWVQSLTDPLKAATELGERRPLITVAAPFPRDDIETRRDEEVAGLDIARTLLDTLTALAETSGRAVRVLLSGRPIGRVAPGSGADPEVSALLVEWQALLDASAAEAPEWERVGWVTVWAGTLPADEMKKLFDEYPGTDGPISRFARALHIEFYDRKSLHWHHLATPVAMTAAVARVPHSASFLAQLPSPERDQPVNAVAVLYNSDFTKRPKGAARRKLAFVGSFPYKKD